MSDVSGRLALVVLGLFLVLSYLLLRGSAPDAAQYEQRLRAIDALTLSEAALQRDVLRASGLLRDYDPLVPTAARLRRRPSSSAMPARRRGPRARSWTASPPASTSRGAARRFESARALLQNSLTYFGTLSHGLGTPASPDGDAVALVVGELANRVFRFVGGSSDEAASAEVAALLAQLSMLAAPAGLADDIAALRAHGGLIVRTLPAVDGMLARLLAMPISEQARALQGLFIKEHRHAERVAWVFRVLLTSPRCCCSTISAISMCGCAPIRGR